jgi:enterochelin esterase-like enzyme
MTLPVSRRLALTASAGLALIALPVAAQAPPARPAAPPPIVSPEILADGRVTFRISAPNAASVALTGEVPAPPSAAPRAPGTPAPSAVTMVKGPDGLWSGTTAVPVAPGAWRYAFNVDGTATLDSRNVLTSPSQGQVRSLLVTPGDFSEQRNVPHGALAEVAYEARSYGPGTQRKVYVYTPPGYEKSAASYPVLYLLHGGGDTAASWATVGRANFILDNLIAEKKAVPFILVMMSGWTPRGPQSETIDASRDPFNAEFVGDIIPMIESRYRVKAQPASRALSGLSMGGYQTLTLGMKNIDKFDYVLPMSTGWFTDADRNAFIQANRAAIAGADQNLKLFWWGYGQTDIARDPGLGSMEALRKAGLTRIETLEVPGGHEWSAWRLMLNTIAQKVFR